MAKSWQYGRLRAVALQGVTWLILSASLGVAGFIQHRRTGPLDVRLGAPAVEGRLVVRLPVGWEVVPDPEEGPPRTLICKDFDRQGRERRTLRITQEQQHGRVKGAEYYLANLMSTQHVLPLEPQPFSMLGQDDGVLIPFKADFSQLRGLRGAAAIDLPEPGLYGCVVLPDGFAVTVQVVGDGAYGPSSRQLLRLVADNIKLADTVSANPAGR